MTNILTIIWIACFDTSERFSVTHDIFIMDHSSQQRKLFLKTSLSICSWDLFTIFFSQILSAIVWTKTSVVIFSPKMENARRILCTWRAPAAKLVICVTNRILKCQVSFKMIDRMKRPEFIDALAMCEKFVPYNLVSLYLQNVVDWGSDAKIVASICMLFSIWQKWTGISLHIVISSVCPSRNGSALSLSVFVRTFLYSVPDGCVDTNSLCANAAKMGECKMNADYMNVQCRKSCGKC